METEVQAGLTFEQQIKAAKDKEELAAIAEKLGLNVDGRMTIEKLKKGLLDAYKAMSEESKNITKESSKKMVTEEDPEVEFKFTILDISNAEEMPAYEFNFDCGRGVPKGGVIPRWSFMHGEICKAPYSIYEHLKELSIPRSKWVADPASPAGQKSVVYQQKRFGCELIMDKEQILKMQKVA